jgi:hypothetical protein
MGTPLNEEKSEMDFSGFSGVSDVKSTKTILNGRPTYIITWKTEDDPGTSHQNLEALIGNSDNSLWLVIVLNHSNPGEPTAQTVLNSIAPLESSNLNNGQSLPSNVGEPPSSGESSNNNQQPGENSGNNNNQPPTEGGGGGNNNQPQPLVIPHF